MLLAGYASDSGSDSDAEATVKAPAKAPSSANTGSGVKPTGGQTTAAKAKRSGPIKITLDLPKSKSGSKGAEDDSDDERDHEEGRDAQDDDERDTKRAKTGPKGGKGSSSLLGMLPAPKRKLPVAQPDKKSSLMVNRSMATSGASSSAAAHRLGYAPMDDDDEEASSAGPSTLLPPSMARKAKQAKKDDSLDLFGLSTSASSTAAPLSSSASSSELKPPSITSAPAVADFVPPEPGPNDPYPGYYQLPSGQWAAYDPDYYHSFFNAAGDAKASAEKDGGKVGRHWADYDRSMEIADVQASMGIEEARAEEARRQSMARPKTGDQYEYQPIGQVKGLAAERHQLTSLLSTAFSQREELENRIASNKKNARAGKAKYGF